MPTLVGRTEGMFAILKKISKLTAIILFKKNKKFPKYFRSTPEVRRTLELRDLN